jgi:hypothetical protein
MLSLRKLCFLLLGSIWLLSSSAVCAAADDTDNNAGVLNSLRDTYDNLPPHGKLATGAVAGFAVSRMAISSAVKVAKIAGAAFIA